MTNNKSFVRVDLTPAKLERYRHLKSLPTHTLHKKLRERVYQVILSDESYPNPHQDYAYPELVDRAFLAWILHDEDPEQVLWANYRIEFAERQKEILRSLADTFWDDSINRKLHEWEKKKHKWRKENYVNAQSPLKQWWMLRNRRKKMWDRILGNYKRTPLQKFISRFGFH